MRQLVHRLLERAASSHPDNVAVEAGTRQMSYAELEARANRVAHLLGELGVQRGDRVGLYLDKSPDAIVGVYAALKAGAAYVPLDPLAPPARLACIAGNCAIRCVLSSQAKAHAWPSLTEGAPLVEAFVALDGPVEPLPDITVVNGSSLDHLAATPPELSTVGLDLAYLLYTSGSTGEPKGVMHSHRNCLAFVDWACEEFAVGPGDRVSSHAPLHFDLSTFDVFAAAASAATLVLVPGRASLFPVELARFISERRISVWYSVPSVLSMMVLRGSLQPGAFPRLRTILFAGEVFPTKYLRRLMALLPHVRFCNLYGPTETNVCTWYDVPALPDDMVETIPIGRAIADVEVFAVTDESHRAADGELGELWVRGCTVMQGYWGDPEGTARSLVANPFRTELRDLAYRTGDMVRRDGDGTYRFLGRRDAQVKSRGYRIELGEIESALYAHDAVVECVALARPDEMVTNRIEAYVVVRNDVSEADLVRFCADRIPRYMIPEAVHIRPSLPKTSTGKIDRQSLQRLADPRHKDR